MMPEVGRVLDAARLVVSALPGFTGRVDAIEALREAMEALDAKLALAGHEPSKVEQERAWGEVVAGDEILSAKTNRWYEVTRMIKDGKGRVKVNILGSPKPITREIMERTMVRRGVMGEAADILETLWSMQTRPDVIASKEEDVPLAEEAKDDD